VSNETARILLGGWLHSYMHWCVDVIQASQILCQSAFACLYGSLLVFRNIFNTSSIRLTRGTTMRFVGVLSLLTVPRRGTLLPLVEISIDKSTVDLKVEIKPANRRSASRSQSASVVCAGAGCGV
jgi:hypothetical protein